MTPTTYTLITIAAAIILAVALREYRPRRQRTRAMEWVWDARHMIETGAILAPIVVERAMQECEDLGMIEESAMLEEYFCTHWLGQK